MSVSLELNKLKCPVCGLEAASLYIQEEDEDTEPEFEWSCSICRASRGSNHTPVTFTKHKDIVNLHLYPLLDHARGLLRYVKLKSD